MCNLSKGCGYGCQLHHVTYCLITAYALERTLVLESKGWRYATAGWESVFQPLSSNCLDRQGQGARHWSGKVHITQVFNYLDRQKQALHAELIKYI